MSDIDHAKYVDGSNFLVVLDGKPVCGTNPASYPGIVDYSPQTCSKKGRYTNAFSLKSCGGRGRANSSYSIFKPLHLWCRGLRSSFVVLAGKMSIQFGGLSCYPGPGDVN